MQVQIILICGFAVVFGMALLLARKCGSKAATLAALKAELKKQAQEQENARKIMDRVWHLSADDARRRLHDVANKQR